MRLRLSIALAGLALATLSPSLARADNPWDGGDAAAGKIVFNKCGLCHNVTDKAKIGPGLLGVVGRPSGSVAGYNYSTAMKAYNHVWTPENLFTYLAGPMKVVPGTKMSFAGLPNETDRKNVIAYLETLK
jgi:cytochrome c